MTTHPPTDVAGHIREGVEVANIPSLLMMLYHLTADERWLSPPFQPRRNRGMETNDDGGLGPDEQREIRAAACVAIQDYLTGKPPALQTLDDQQAVKLLSMAMGEEVPAEYAPLVQAELGNLPAREWAGQSVDGQMDAVIIGAGASGICAAKKLGDIGVDCIVLEAEDSVGGTWVHNHYPGAGVDTPSHLYSFSFAPFDWSRYFALQPELQKYLDHVVDKFELRTRIRFGHAVETARFDARLNRWFVKGTAGDGSPFEVSGQFLISAVGLFNPPAIPDFEGRDEFEGQSFHTAQWPVDFDPQGKKIAVIGSGASAMQVVPALAPQVSELKIIQRTPQWVSPFDKFDTPVPAAERRLFREVDLYRRYYRLRLAWTFNDRVYKSLIQDPDWDTGGLSINALNDRHRTYLSEYINDQLGGRPDLLHGAVPTYPPFGKRMLMDNGWFQTLKRPNVSLVRGAMQRFVKGGIQVDNEQHDADVVLFATGFDVLKYLSSYETYGTGGRRLRDEWGNENARAYLGLTTPGFPNMFFLYGPNAQPGHGGSFLFMAEAQMDYIAELCLKMSKAGIKAVEVRDEPFQQYNEAIDQQLAKMIWSHPAMETYYRNSSGRIVVNLPYTNLEFWKATQSLQLEDYSHYY